MILLLLATAALCVGSWRFALALGLRRSVNAVTPWLVVLSAQICLVMLAVGLAGQLRPVPLAVAAGAVAALDVLWSVTVRRSTPGEVRRHGMPAPLRNKTPVWQRESPPQGDVQAPPISSIADTFIPGPDPLRTRPQLQGKGFL